MNQPAAFNPLSYESIQDSLSNALMSSELIPLEEVEKFEGNGIYALFYEGDFPAYRVLSSVEAGTWPIYVGKAAPSTRKGEETTEDELLGPYTGGPALFLRMKDHRKSISDATNLRIEDFSVKLLVLSYIWVPLAETSMISCYQPVWNKVVDGFGNHDPGSGRYKGVRPRWDTLHPGRTWAERLQPRPETPQDIEQDIVEFLSVSMN